MKYIAILAAAALSASAVAHADPISVETPKTPASAEEAAAYVSKLNVALKQVCREATGPIIGVAYYTYLDCVKETRAQVAKQDPTGLFAAQESTESLVVAAR